MWFIGIDSSLRRPAFVVFDDVGDLVAGAAYDVPVALRGAPRLAAIRTVLANALDGCDAALTGCIEGPSLDSPHREFDLGEVSGVCREYCFGAHGCDPHVVPPSTLKLFTTGHGDADKTAMIHAVKRHWGFDAGEDDDLADAYALARLARALVHGPGSRRCEHDVVKAILHPPPPKRRVRKTRPKDDV